MILKRLAEFADTLAEIPPPGYQPRFITKAIRLRLDGSLVDVVSLSGEKRGAREGQELFVPQEAPRRASGIKARLIADSPNYALAKPREKDKPEQVRDRHAAYCELVRECVDSTHEPSVEAVLKWIEAGGPAALCDDSRVTENDDLVFEVDGVRPTDLPRVRDFWANRDKAEHEATCIVTGQFGPVVDRMPAPIKGVPGGQTTGTTLVSVNFPAGESYGLDAALNSPIGKATSEKIGNALNWLLASEQHSLRIGKAVYIYWTRKGEEFDFMSLLREPKAEDVRGLLLSPHRGRESASVQSKDFFALCLSANVSRVVIRDYHETTIEVAKACLARWFNAIKLVPLNGGEPEPMSIFRLAISLFREANDMPAHVPVALLRSAFAGTPLPDYLLGLAVKRNLAMQGPYTEYNKKRVICEPRLAIIKAIIEQKEGNTLVSLNTDHPDSAYHCGRLLALLERIQRAALGDINATVVDRYYGSACSSPGSILGNLVNNAQPHLAKLRKDHRDFYQQTALEEVLSAIGDSFPRTLDIQRQGLFALGFYHQKAHDRAQAIANKNMKATEGEAQ